MDLRRQRVRLWVDYASGKYRGVTTLSLENVDAPVIFHSVDLRWTSVQANGKDVKPEPTDEPGEYRLSHLSAGSSDVRIEFEGQARPGEWKGFYRSSFGKDAHLLTTELEPNDARRFIPCIDLPSVKTVFEFEVTTSAAVSVIFNTPVAAETRSGDEASRRFQETPRMSTYLLYLGIGPMEERTARAGAVEIRAVAPRGRGDETSFALEEGVRFLPYLEEYFGIPFPLPKIHLIPVPDYAAGAMENWGAITFRESRLLRSPASPTSGALAGSETLAHELVHQWFGNLVTLMWWDELWLNESFATFLGNKAVDQMHPEWEVWNDFFLTRTAGALLWDSLPSTHPIEAKVTHAYEINAIFDEISYGKGGNVLRMVEAYLGEKEFQKGVHRYLEEHAYGNAVGADFWGALERASGRPIASIVEAWVRRPGYPRIRVHLRDGSVELKQQLYRVDGSRGPEDIRPIPIRYRVDGRVVDRLMEGETLVIPAAHPEEFQLNLGHVGFYRVQYDDRLFQSLMDRWSTLAPEDRWTIIQDQFSFLLGGEWSISRFLALVDQCASDPNELPVSEMIARLRQLLPLWEPDPVFRQSYLHLTRTQLELLGMEARAGESHRRRILRGTVLQAAVRLDEELGKRWAQRWGEIDTVDPDLRAAVITAIARWGGPDAYSSLRDRMQTAPTDEKAAQYAAGLGQLKEPSQVLEALRAVGRGEISRTLGVPIILGAATNTEAAKVMAQWLDESLPRILEAFRGTALASTLLQATLPYLWVRNSDRARDLVTRPGMELASVGIRKGSALGGLYRRMMGLDPKVVSDALAAK